MMMPDPYQISRSLASRFGIAFTVTAGEDSDGPWLDVLPADLHPNEGFTVRTQFGWRSVSATFRPGKFSADLIAEMDASARAGSPAFRAMARLLEQEGGKLSMAINSKDVNPSEPASWEGPWRSFALSVRKSPHLVNEDDGIAVEREVLFWGGGIVGMALSLVPIDELPPEADAEDLGLPEGAKVSVEVNRYERSRINRAVCIAAHGTVCKACDFDFAAVYGELGAGYIHIHHVIPVSRMGAGYVVDPVADLVPLCPNCHAIAHRVDPPLSLVDLKRIIVVRNADPAKYRSSVACRKPPRI